MRVILVNWAKIWDGAAYGGGVNGYAQALALHLTAKGHEVVWLSAGTTYSGVQAQPGEDLGPVHAIRHQDWMGVKVLEIVNSPVLAPSAFQRDDANAEISQPDLERVCAQIFQTVRPDVIHFHNIEGFSAGCIRVASRGLGEWEGCATLYSLHNYHTLTPEVYLPIEVVGLYEKERTPIDPAVERRRRAGLLIEQPVVEQALEPTPACRLLTEGFDQPYQFPGDDPRGMAPALRNQQSTAFVPKPLSPEWASITNDPTLPIGDGFDQRRAAMVRALNTCDRVLAVSRFVHKRFEADGVEPGRLSTLAIGTRVREVCAQHSELLFDPPPREVGGTGVSRRPLRLVFLGYDHAYKGLHVLADALELIVPEILSQIHLWAFAQAGHRSEWRFRRLEPRLARLEYHHGYSLQDVPWMLGGKDLGVVPSIWWDNGPQTVFELLACGVPVLGADLGGIPDAVRHEENGLLFRGNDRYDLARQIVRAVREPGLVERLRSGVRPPKSMAEHGEEIEVLLKQVIAGRVPMRAAVHAGGRDA